MKVTFFHFCLHEKPQLPLPAILFHCIWKSCCALYRIDEKNFGCLSEVSRQSSNTFLHSNTNLQSWIPSTRRSWWATFRLPSVMSFYTYHTIPCRHLSAAEIKREKGDFVCSCVYLDASMLGADKVRESNYFQLFLLLICYCEVISTFTSQKSCKRVDSNAERKFDSFYLVSPFFLDARRLLSWRRVNVDSPGLCRSVVGVCNNFLFIMSHYCVTRHMSLGCVEGTVSTPAEVKIT